jgi:hypothetical protein
MSSSTSTPLIITDDEIRAILRENIPEVDILGIPGRLLQPSPFPCYAIMARLIPDPLIRQQVLDILTNIE